MDEQDYYGPGARRAGSDERHVDHHGGRGVDPSMDENGLDEPQVDAGLPEERARNPWLGIVLRTLVAVIILGAAYAGLSHYLGGRIPNNTSVDGIDIGNLSPSQAQSTLETRLALKATDPVIVSVDGERLEIDPVRDGLGFDIEGTLAGLTGVSYDPRVVWSRLMDEGGEIPLRLVVDDAQVQARFEELAQDFDTPPQEGSVALALGEVQVTPSTPGRALDAYATAETVIAAWPDQRRLEGTMTEVLPDLSAAEIERFVTEQAEPALSSSIVVEVDDFRGPVTTNQLSRLLTVVQSENHILDLELDEETLVEIVRGATDEAVVAPRDARARLGDDGEPEVVPARVGTEIDEDAIVSAVREVLYLDDPDSRVVQVPTLEVEPELTTEEAQAWRLEEMAEFRSQFPTGASNAARTENIRVGLTHLNGLVIMPGEQFSLAESLSPITEDRGYVRAGVIVDGRLVEGLGGGLSQVSTTVLNTAWFSGLRIDEFTPHSYYIPRYPVGREATLAVGIIDNLWTNDTDAPVIIQTWIEDDEIVMRFWGDRQYTVETVTGERRNVIEPGESEDDSEECLPQAAAEGFDITVTRILKRSGEEVDRQSWNTRYQPSDAIRCTHPDHGG